MADTYYVRYETTDGIATFGGFSALGTVNQPFVQQVALLSIFNRVGSNCVSVIKKIEVNDAQARTNTITINNLSLIRTTGQVGGIPIPVIPMDTTDTPLPAEVLIVQYPGEITTTGDPFRVMQGRTCLQLFSPLTGIAAPRLGMINDALAGSNIYANYFTTDTQSITLQEGEGIALSTGGLAPYNFPYEIVVRLSDGAATHYVNTVVNNCAMPALIGVFNGAGSGVVLTVERIEFSEIKQNIVPVLYSIESISDVYGGADITPIALDTANPALPSGIAIVSNGVALSASPDSSTSIRSRSSGDIPFRRFTMSGTGVGPELSTGLATLKDSIAVRFDFSPSIDPTGGFVLREGDGIALFDNPNAVGSSSAVINYEIVVRFTNVYTPPAGGEHSCVFVG